jgi:tetratricopeptide (TPR) repeat protein
MRLSAIALLLAVGSPSWASTSQDLEDLNVRISDVEGSLAGLAENFNNRSGLLGAGEARLRYSDSVVHFLLEDYDKAARGFFTLVQSGALQDPNLIADCQWYLGDSLFEVGNYALAQDAFQIIIDAGFSHPMFADAVRRQLEVYGVTGQAERFYSLYNSYVVTNRVAPNDLIVYTLAKSFYRQGDLLRAKSLFSDIQEGSRLFMKARYFLGTVRVVEGDYVTAIADYERVVRAGGEPEYDEEGVQLPMDEVTELAHLALARLYYESGEFLLSTQHYDLISRQSPHFSEALFEMVWSYIKQENYNEALRTVQLFLLAFPEHRFTAELKLLQGNLHMILNNEESALTTFEGIVSEYSPIQLELRGLVTDDESAMRWFEQLASSDAEFEIDSGLPVYAIEMLRSNNNFSRAQEAVTELNTQESEITVSEQMIVDIDEALGGAVRGLGSFQRAHDQLEQVEAEGIRIQLELLESQGAQLLNSVDGEAGRAVVALEVQRARLAEAMRLISQRSNQTADQLQVFEDQVRAVQARAFRSKQIAIDLRDEALDLIDMLDAGESSLWSERVPAVRTALEAVVADAEVEISSLGELEGEVALRTIMAPIERSAGSFDVTRAHEAIRVEIDAIVSQYAQYAMSEGLSNTADFVLAHSRLDALGQGVDGVAVAMARIEQSEIATVRRSLEEERTRVTDSRVQADSMSGGAESISLNVTRSGFQELESVFGDQIMRADMGLVDVFWERSESIEEEINALLADQKEQRRILEARFDRVQQVMGE